MVVKEIIGDGLAGFCSDAFILILFSIAAASALGYAITIAAGRLMSRIVDTVPAEPLADGALVLMSALVLLLTGPWGLAILAVSAFVGMLPQRFGVARVCLASCLLIPAIMTQTGIV